MKTVHSIISSLMCAVALSISPASAAPTASIGSGTTTVRFNDAFTSTLASGNLRLSKVEESSLKRNLVTFPVIEGALDLADARGEVEHSGGFRLSTKTDFFRFTNLILDTQNLSPIITAEVILNDSVIGRIPLFDVTLPTLTLPLRSAKTITVSGLVLRLRSEAADALNTAFDRTIFRSGQRVGRAVATLNTGRSQ